jgi:YidC/Oxa1 family membrane protein insertase
LKKETRTKLLGGLGLLAGVVLLSGCTANFCSNLDMANMAYPYEQGVTVYVAKEDVPAEYSNLSWQVYAENANVYAYIPVDSSGTYAAKKATYLVSTIISTAKSSGYNIPSLAYWKAMDQKVLDAAVAKSGKEKASLTVADINPFKAAEGVTMDAISVADCVGNETGLAANSSSVLRLYGYQKFYGEDGKLWTTWDAWNNELKATLGAEQCPDNDFATLYKKDMNGLVSGQRSCIATVDNAYGHYGNSSNWAVSIEPVTWGQAWGKGLLEGLIIYPVSWMVDNFAYSMDPSLSGWGQIWSIVLVTLIVRVILLAATFKSTLDQQKMQAMQPETAKLQAKYPNSNTNKAEAARLQQETMALYRRNKVNPASTFITMLIQFPVFIAVWGALQGSAVLSSGEVLGLRLSDSIQTVLTNTKYLPSNYNGWWTALVLFILMSVFQFLAMMLPQWITKHRTKNMPKTSANPAADKTASTMKWMMYGMLVVTIIMGFALPAAMGVYWAIGAIISMLQTVITQLVMAKNQAKGKRL